MDTITGSSSTNAETVTKARGEPFTYLQFRGPLRLWQWHKRAKTVLLMFSLVIHQSRDLDTSEWRPHYKCTVSGSKKFEIVTKASVYSITYYVLIPSPPRTRQWLKLLRTYSHMYRFEVFHRLDSGTSEWRIFHISAGLRSTKPHALKQMSGYTFTYVQDRRPPRPRKWHKRVDSFTYIICTSSRSTKAVKWTQATGDSYWFEV